MSLGVSGGIAGVQRGIEVGPGASVVLVDREGRHAGRDLSGAEREKLGSLLEAVDFAGLPARSIDAGSGDRFEYRLEHDGHTVITDRSTSLGAADDLIDHLEDCMDARRPRAVRGTPANS
ncbi:hypothetical protein [Streptomyces sp. NPDC053542]|uniref:hypothetical protein n=1 Tax=Streptomyces sp. NPDC053542 TaxID=3365710 RepID=UPI0037D4DCAE